MVRCVTPAAALLIAVLADTGAPISAAPPGGRQRTPSQSAQPSLAAAIDSYIGREMQARQIPGLAIAVLEHGTIIFNKAYGIANLEADAPVTADSIFELASLTKPFTAAAIMLLVEDGKIRLDDPITAYIDQAPEAWKTRTIRQTLSHTAGFPLDAIVRHEGSPLLTISTKQAFDYIARAPLLFPAGERGAYSDGGYFLLGMVIEKASGQAYGEFLRRRIFEPLGMKDSSVREQLKIVKNRVPVYALGKGEVIHWGRDWQYELPSFFGVLSTTADLARWDAAMVNGSILKASSLEQMWTPARLTNGQEARVTGQPYGLGWILGDFRGHRSAAHEGASGTLIVRFLDDGLTIIVLTNLGVPSGNNVGSIARSIAGLVNPAYRPPHMMTAQPDPAPHETETLHAAVSDLIEGKDPAIVIAGAAAALTDLPVRARNDVFTQLKTLKPFVYLGSDELEGRGFRRHDQSISKAVYYRALTGGRTFYFMFWLTRDGKIADMQFYGQ